MVSPGLRVYLFLLVSSCAAEIILQDANTSKQFCKANQQSMQCNFANTTQPVVLSANFNGSNGLKILKINSASSLEANIPCYLPINILTSRNITINGGEIDANHQIPQDHYSTLNNSNTESVLFFPDSKIENKNKCPRSVSVGTSELVTNINGHLTNLELDRVSVKNVLVHVSKNMKVKGETIEHFNGIVENLELNDVTVISMSSYIHNMKIYGGKVHNLGIEVRNARLENVKIDKITNVTITEQLELINSPIEEISPNGLTVLRHRDSLQSESRINLLMDSNIQNIMENGIIISDSYVVIQGAKINHIENKAIIVNGGGTLNLQDVTITNPVRQCIQLNGKATLNMTNVTINHRLFTQFIVQNTYTDFPLYPISLFIQSISTTASPPIENRINRSKPSSGVFRIDTTTKLLHGSALYLVIGILLLGLVIGLAIGCSLHMGRFFQKRKKKESVSIRFSELISRESEEDPQSNNTYDTIVHRRPSLMRQDSGVSSSSFGSYAGFLDGRRSRPGTNNTNVIYENPEILDKILDDDSRYIHMNKGNENTNTYVVMGKETQSVFIREN
ncbi:unnamed protein product [Meganyctiphanes norvegica]|uniref:Uncharacterized protein n=1 Tax=Meganyctiphanes norvegica TaxID=48144 RepID=A0AAV2S2I6_MEGNR